MLERAACKVADLTALHHHPGDGDEHDDLQFGDVAMGQSKTVTFTLRNLSTTARKFSWQSVAGLTFSPSVGHLLPKSAKTVTATFAPAEATAHEAVPASLELQRIRYTAEYDDWDDSMKVVKYLTEEEFQARELALRAAAEAEARAKREAEEAAAAAAAEAEAAASKGKKGGKDKGKKPEPEPEPAPAPAEEEAAPAADEPALSPMTPGGGSPNRRRKVIDTEPEPEHELLPPPEPAEGEEPAAAEPPLQLLISGKCEFGALECETSTLAFRPTMMFQARSHTFELRNTGAVELSVAWHIEAEGKEDPFSVSPQEGVIAAGEAMQVTVTFSPQEVDSFARALHCSCSNLAEGQPPPTVQLSGKSKRPYCHFELAEGGYVREGRRSPEMPGPDGSLGPLDPATKVIEFESLGTKVRNTRRFFVVNPTSVPYDFLWESEAERNASTETLASQHGQSAPPWWQRPSSAPAPP